MSSVNHALTMKSGTLSTYRSLKGPGVSRNREVARPAIPDEELQGLFIYGVSHNLTNLCFTLPKWRIRLLGIWYVCFE